MHNYKMPAEEDVTHSVELQELRDQLAARAKSEDQTLLLTRLVFHISIALAREGSLRTMLNLCCEALVQELGAAFARVWTLRPGESALELQASAGLYTHIDGGHSRVPVGAYKIGRIAESRRPHLSNDVPNDCEVSDPEWARREGMVAFAGHPLVTGDKLLGVLAVFSRSRFDESTLQVLATTASLVAHGIDREWLREKTEAALQAAERSNDALERFATVASHDLQEPLRQVTAFSEMLTKRYYDRFDADGQQFLTFILDGAERMNRLIQGLLAYAQIESMESLPRETVSSEAALQEALENLRLSINESHASVTHEDPLPELRGNSTQITQLFQNLVGNALKYRGNDDPRIHIRADREPEAWHFSVSDNGVGIEPAHRVSIFEVFARLHGPEISGTGLGLAFCTRIVQLHRGRIWVEANPNSRSGSIFHFTISH